MLRVKSHLSLAMLQTFSYLEFAYEILGFEMIEIPELKNGA